MLDQTEHSSLEVLCHFECTEITPSDKVNKIMAEHKCDHLGCRCAVAHDKGVTKGDKTYCSEHCATAGTSSTGACQCGHADCK